MRISILANNPVFIEQHGGLIERHAHDSDIFVSIKLKYIEPLLGLPIRRHDIHFRSDSRNFIFGLDDYRHLLKIACSRSNFYLINDSEHPDHDTANDTQGIRFKHFDKGRIEWHLGTLGGPPVPAIIKRHTLPDGRLDMRRFSTGLMVILHYSLEYPDADLHLLGFYERGNRKVLKEGRILRETHFHDFEEERMLLETEVGNIRLIP
jgi:hypothetical protein